MSTPKPKTVDEYISQFPRDVQLKLNEIRHIVLSIAQEVEEGISYGMAAYKLNKKPFVYFAAYKQHIGLYAMPTAHKAFARELSNYKHGKGSVQFPLDRKIPFDLIGRIVKHRANNIRQIDEL